MTTTLLFEQVIDGVREEPIMRGAIRVDNGRIAWIGRESELPRPRDDTVIDANNLTALPGLVNCHDHTGIDPVKGQPLQQTIGGEPIEYLAMRAVKNARIALRAGDTTIRDVAGRGRVSSMLRRLIEERVVPGPRMLIAGRNIVRTGGHGWFIGRTADGADGFRQAIRAEIHENNVDLIKIMVTGGLAVPEQEVFIPELTDEEVNAVVHEAHRLGRKVAAHGAGGAGVRAAVEAGVDSIEHGTFLTDEEIHLMVARGTYFVSTVGILEKIGTYPRADELPDRMTQGIRRVREILSEGRRAGLRVAVGTDPMHGQLHREIAFLTEAGYTTLEAIGVATRKGAELCGIEDRVGTLEVGKAADVIGLPGDVLADITRLKDVSFVMKDGIVEFAADHKGAWADFQ